MIVAIDGPAGSGKSTVARALARQLGFAYLDTGAMYRCAAMFALDRLGGLDATPERIAAIAPQLASLRIELRDGDAGGGPRRVLLDGRDADAGGGPRRVLLDGRDVTEEIRTPEVSEMASLVAADPGVRTALVAKQRELLAEGDWVAEGRDIGTAVAPEAQVKVFLSATPQERAARRAAELGADVQRIAVEQAIRDARDAGREHSPLRAAADAVAIDTTGMSVEQVVERIAALAREEDAPPER